MKPLRLVLIVSCLSIICTQFSVVVSALEQDEAVIELTWSNETIYPGSNVTVTAFFISRCSEDLAIHRLGFHFDWMASNFFATLDISDSPAIVPSNGTHFFDPMIILIPEDVSGGTHSYFVRIEGLQGAESTYFSWQDSDTRTLEVYEGAGANGQQDYLLLIFAVVLVVAVTVLIIILMRARKKKTSARTGLRKGA